MVATAAGSDSKQQQIIEAYIRAYNKYDIAGMLEHMHHNIRFQNISDNEISVSTFGLDELKSQAEKAVHIFKEREQRITRFEFRGNRVEVDIRFRGVLSVDLPNGWSAGEEVEVNGRSVFRFADDKIIDLKDYTL